MFLTIVVFIAVLSLLVFVHELGHFLTARKLGVKAEEFGFGFPPRVFGFYRDQKRRWRFVWGNQSLENLAKKGLAAPSGTVYSLNWIFAGGFVKIKGQDGEEPAEADSFVAKATWKKALILFAGVAMNVILAWLLLSAGFLKGLPQDLETISPQAKVSDVQIVVIEIIPDTPAEAAGLNPGEIIKSIDGQEIYSISQLQNIVDNQAGQEINLTIDGPEGGREVKIIPEFNPEIDRAGIGVGIYGSGTASYPFFEAFWQGAKNTGWYLKLIVMAFYNLFADLLAGESVDGQVGGPVAIAQYTGEVARFGFVYLLQFVAILSLNLAIINILPIPALDGGRLLFLVIEKLKGRPMRREIEGIIHMIGFWLLISLIIFITYKDIARFF